MDFPLISDSFGTGAHGKYLVDLTTRLHVVVECFLFATPPDSAGNEAVHRQVARQGMDERFRRNEEYFANLRQKVLADPVRYESLSANTLGPTDRFCIRYDIAAAASAVVAVEDFLREYRYALTEPPHGIRVAVADRQAFCDQNVAHLFGDLSEFTIRKWSADWSNYFDGGNEWWGAFLWTLVCNDGRGWWVGAATTD